MMILVWSITAFQWHLLQKGKKRNWFRRTFAPHMIWPQTTTHSWFQNKRRMLRKPIPLIQFKLSILTQPAGQQVQRGVETLLGSDRPLFISVKALNGRGSSPGLFSVNSRSSCWPRILRLVFTPEEGVTGAFCWILNRLKKQYWSCCGVPRGSPPSDASW